MIKGCKICGIKDPDTLNYIINHPYSPEFIGFICNYKKSVRYVELNTLKKLLNVKKNKSKFVAVLVKPNHEILEEIKALPFDYYQLYDCTPDEVKNIRQTYQKKIITALTIKDKSDVSKYKSYTDVTDIYLFDSKGYEKSLGFDHNLIKDIKLNKELMLAGNIKFNDNLRYYEKIADYIDLSGGLETCGFKDKSKIEIFLNNLNKISNETKKKNSIN
ncbi:phosphoribosylanthranilate isomerase [Candidatus Pelagibacter sp.]|nr:phosphoribosylanthranilate isomerase [Candidatus Pelagibacter sp.]